MTASPPGEGPGAPVRAVELDVEGMHCASCAALIEDVLGEVPGVAEVHVDLTAARARVRIADDAHVDPQVLCTVIDQNGYRARRRDSEHEC